MDLVEVYCLKRTLAQFGSATKLTLPSLLDWTGGGGEGGNILSMHEPEQVSMDNAVVSWNVSVVSRLKRGVSCGW